MAAFQFPDPALQTTVTNPITGSTYQWKEPPGKWIVTVKMRDVNDIIWEGDNPPSPIGEYKLWYSTDTLELYFYYCDSNGVCAWVPTSVPIQVLEDLNAFAAEAEIDIDQLQYNQQLLQNAVDQIVTDAVTYDQVKQEISDAVEEITETLSFGNFSYIPTSAARGIGVLTSFAEEDNTLGTTNPANVKSLGVHYVAGDGSAVGWTSLSPGDVIRWARGGNVWQFRVNGTPVAQDTGDMLWYQIPVNRGTGSTFIDSGIGNFDYTLSILKLTAGSADLDDYLRIDGTSKMAGDLDMNRNNMKMINNIGFQSIGTIGNEGLTKLRIRTTPDGNDGSAQVEVVRPSNQKRGFAIRGSGEDKSVQMDLLYSYHSLGGTSDSVIYQGATNSDNALQTQESVLDLIASGGIGSEGNAFQRHGPYHFKPGDQPVFAGQFTSNSDVIKDVREFTFARKNTFNMDQVWPHLAIGEVITIVQESDDFIITVNYTVTGLQNFTYASIVSVDAHQTVITYSDGHVLYNPDTFRFQEDTDTFAIESPPANLNNVLDVTKKASPGPAYNSYVVQSSSDEPEGGVEAGMMIFSGSLNLQSPTKFIFSCYDKYGNGHRFGNNSFNCPGSTVELYEKNRDGTLILCKIYEFNRVEASDNKYEFLNLVEIHSASTGNGYISSPGYILSNTEYLVDYQFNFSSSTFTVDEDGDPHYAYHRLAEVGTPIASTDAATKDYVDTLFDTRSLPVYGCVDKQMEQLQNGEFVCFDSSNNYTKLLGAVRAIMWKGVDANDNRPMRDADAITWEGNLNSTFSLLTNNGSKTIMRASMSQVINGHPTILYNAFYDVYCIAWSGGDTTVNTSDLTTLADSQTVAFHCPELFF